MVCADRCVRIGGRAAEELVEKSSGSFVVSFEYHFHLGQRFARPLVVLEKKKRIGSSNNVLARSSGQGSSIGFFDLSPVGVIDIERRVRGIALRRLVHNCTQTHLARALSKSLPDNDNQMLTPKRFVGV